MNTIEGPFGKQIASDIVRDGLGVELLHGGKVVAEVFRCDADHTLTITTFDNCLPLVAIEELIAVARVELGTFEDGKPLPPERSRTP